MRYIIMGGVASGASFATRLRRLDEKSEIIIYEMSGYVSYANCGLPYFIGDIIKDKSCLTLETPLSFKEKFNIDVLINHQVIKIDYLNKKIIIKDCLSGIRSYLAYRILVNNNFKAYNLSGGYRIYQLFMNNKSLENEAIEEE